MGTLSKAYQDAYNKIQNTVEKAITENGDDLLLRYSAYDWDDNDIPLNNLNEVPVKGKIKFKDEGEFFDNYTPFESEVMNSPTWLDIAVVANKMIHVTGDKHHVFIERLECYDDGSGVTVATIIMGS